MKIAVIGDFHIPSRVRKIPEKIKKKLKEESPEIIICTGDIGNKKTLKELQKIAKTKTVKGNTDKENFPRKIQLEKKGIKITALHGDQIFPRGNKDRLRYIAEQEDTDILIHGHTHQLDIEKIKEKLFVNPGTATGAWSGGGSNPKPSFITIEINQKIKIKKIKEDKTEIKTYEFN